LFFVFFLVTAGTQTFKYNARFKIFAN